MCNSYLYAIFVFSFILNTLTSYPWIGIQQTILNYNTNCSVNINNFTFPLTILFSNDSYNNTFNDRGGPIYCGFHNFPVETPTPTNISVVFYIMIQYFSFIPPNKWEVNYYFKI